MEPQSYFSLLILIIQSAIHHQNICTFPLNRTRKEPQFNNNNLIYLYEIVYEQKVINFLEEAKFVFICWQFVLFS